MPSVLERFNRPSYQEYDPSLLPDINFGFAESKQSGGDRALKNIREGSFGLLSAHDQVEQVDRETMDLIAPSVERQLSDAEFDKANPEQYMRDIFRMAQETVKDAAKTKDKGYTTRIDMTLVKIFVDPNDNRLKAAYGFVGKHAITYSSASESLRGLSHSITDEVMEQGIGIPPMEEDTASFGVIDFNDGDRLMVQSRNAAGYSQAEKYTPEEIHEADKLRDPNAAAEKLIARNEQYENRTALVIDAPYDYGDDATGWQRFRNLISQRRSERTSKDTGSRKRMLGGLATHGAGGMSSRREKSRSGHLSSWRNRNRPDTDTTAVNGGSVKVDQETERKSKSRKALLLGAIAVGTVLAVRYGLDMGDEAPRWLSGLPDTGVDMNPFGDGDLDDGNRTGWDLNPSNENLAWNDDPVNESFRDTGGFDVFPPFFDGDWFSMNEGLNIDLPNSDGEPNIDIDKDGDVDAPDATVNTPELLLDAPEAAAPPVVEVPEVEVLEAEPIVPPPAPPAPPAWTPDMFTVDNGHGLIQEIHQIGHEIVGYNDFNATDATQVYEAVQTRYGDGFLELTNHAGADLYHHGDELRISAPGQAHWASQEIENFVHEKIREMAAA